MAFTALGAGGDNTCGLTAAGEAYCWGNNWSGRLGVGDQAARAAPAPVMGGLRFRALAAGGSHTCGVTAEGAT